MIYFIQVYNEKHKATLRAPVCYGQGESWDEGKGEGEGEGEGEGDGEGEGEGEGDG